MRKSVLDATCGSRMMWFDKNHPLVMYCDQRAGVFHDSGGLKSVVVNPDVVCDFRKLPFDDSSFRLCVFDPPHSFWGSEKSILGCMYGTINKRTWKEDIRDGFNECWRVLEIGGVLVFKWHTKDVTLNALLDVLPVKPLFGHTSGKHGKTIWLTFMKV